MRENKPCPYQGWNQMPTEELDQILQAELEKEHPNEEVVLPILHELEERNKDIPVETTPEVLEILEKLGKHNTSSKQPIHKWRWLARIAAAAAVVCIVVMTVAPAAQAESLFDILVRWTSSIFEFIDPDNSYPSTDGDFVTDNPGLQQLYEKVTALGVTELVVPMWVPEDFALSELQEMPMSGGTRVRGRFENSDNVISITYRISTDISPKVEKEATGVEVFEAGEISHFIMDNDEYFSVTWGVDGVECLLNTNLAKEDLYTIIKSIYRSELSQ